MPEIKAVVAESGFADLYQMALAHYTLPVLKYPLAELSRIWAMLLLQFDIKTILPFEAAKKLRIPILFIHSQSDAVVPFEHAIQLEKASQHNPQALFYFTETLHHGEFSKKQQALIEHFFDNM